MKKILSILAASTMLTGTAIAGNVEAPVIVDVEPVAVAAGPDWSGLYVGGMASFDSGFLTYENPPGSDPFASYDFEPLTTYGGFVGYNLQNGSLVYGGEVAYNFGGNAYVGYPNDANTFVADLKARVGYAAGNALIYGVAGYSFTEWATSDTYSANGFSYGAGIDYLIGEHFFVGAEYLARSMSGPRADSPDLVGESNLDAAQIRAGWKF